METNRVKPMNLRNGDSVLLPVRGSVEMWSVDRVTSDVGYGLTNDPDACLIHFTNGEVRKVRRDQRISIIVEF